MASHSFSFQGESGPENRTLINSLFLTDSYPERVIPGAAGTGGPALQWQSARLGLRSTARGLGLGPAALCDSGRWAQLSGRGRGAAPGMLAWPVACLSHTGFGSTGVIVPACITCLMRIK